MVVFFHVATRYGPTGLDALGAWFLHFGSKGVDLFFPLSGYLISTFLLTSQRPDFIKVFFLRRVFRIIPLYFTAVTLAMLGMYVTGYQSYLLDRFWINYTFLTAWFIHFQGPDSVPFTITWSLSVEEFAYVIFGLLAWANRKTLPLMLLVLSIAPIFLKLWMNLNGTADFYFLPVARIDSIAIGGIAAWLLARGHRPLLWLALALALAHALSWTSLALERSLTYTQLSLATSIVIVIFETRLKGMRNPLIAFGASIGFYSYFTYLFHILVIEAIFKLQAHFTVDKPNYWTMAILALTLTHLAALLSYRWFEGPLMRYGRGLEKPAPAKVSISGSS